MGQSGRAIIEAIIAGERDAEKLAGLANYRIKKSKKEIAISLEGNWRDDLLFELKSCLSLQDTYSLKLKECDHELEKKIISIKRNNKSLSKTEDASKTVVKQRSKYTPLFDTGKLATEYFGVDSMQVPGVSHNTVLSFLTQVGEDVYKFPTSKHFCSWLRLAPNNKITGGKVISSRTPRGKNRLALALRQAANSIGNQKKGNLVSFFKKIAYKKGRPSAITATARKLATILYQMVVKKEDYIPYEQKEISDKVKNKMIKNIKASVSKLELSDEQLRFLFLNNLSSVN